MPYRGMCLLGYVPLFLIYINPFYMTSISKRAEFKLKFGYSKTMAGLLNKYGMDLTEYRAFRIRRKKALKAVRQEKHRMARIGRKTRDKSQPKVKNSKKSTNEQVKETA